MRTVINRETFHKCILCGFEIKLIHPEEAQDARFIPQSSMWHDGIVDKISAGYGSKIDGDMFLFAVCDTCVIANPDKFKYVGNYM